MRGVQLVNTSTGWLDGFTVLQWAREVPLLGTVLGFFQSLIVAAVFAVCVFMIALFANLVAAPFNGLLAERVEAHLTNTPEPDTPFMTLIKSLPRTIGSEVRKLIYLALMLAAIGLLHLVPLINIVAPVLLITFGAWMFAIEYWDYPMGNHGALFGDVRQYARRKKPAAFGFGAIIALVSTIPIVNFLVMPVAVAGATALWVDHLQQDYSKTP